MTVSPFQPASFGSELYLIFNSYTNSKDIKIHAYVDFKNFKKVFNWISLDGVLLNNQTWYHQLYQTKKRDFILDGSTEETICRSQGTNKGSKTPRDQQYQEVLNSAEITRAEGWHCGGGLQGAVVLKQARSERRFPDLSSLCLL